MVTEKRGGAGPENMKTPRKGVSGKGLCAQGIRRGLSTYKWPQASSQGLRPFSACDYLRPIPYSQYILHPQGLCAASGPVLFF